jgi:AraC-like DNA-binding protein
MLRKQDGFPGQISFVIPEKVLGWVKRNPLISDLYITDIGYYPHARHHFRERRSGSPQHILIYNTEGKGSIQTGSLQFELPGDHYVIIPAGVPHKYASDACNPWSIYWIHFTGKKSLMLANRANKPVAIEKNKLSRIGDRIDMFSDIFSTLDRGLSHENLEYVNLGLGRLLSTFTYLNQFRIMKRPEENDPVARSIDFMLENLNKKLSLSDISKYAGYSVSHFSRLFVSHTGHAPVDYFIQLKMQRACRLLDNSGLSVMDVSREIGIEDPFYFSRVFHKMMQVSPSEYRKRLRGN